MIWSLIHYCIHKLDYLDYCFSMSSLGIRGCDVFLVINWVWILKTRSIALNNYLLSNLFNGLFPIVSFILFTKAFRFTLDLHLFVLRLLIWKVEFSFFALYTVSCQIFLEEIVDVRRREVVYLPKRVLGGILS